MPYSFEKQAKKSANAYLKKIERKVVDPAITLTAEQIVRDLSNAFDKCIDNFYLYKTTSYYRHEVGVGTGNGINLYRANQFRVNYSGKYAKSIHFGWNGNDMDGYKLHGVGSVDREHVLDSVMNGIRFDGDGSEYYNRWIMTWELSSPIETKYFGTISGRTPDNIFEQMLDNMFFVQRKLASNNFKELYAKSKNK